MVGRKEGHGKRHLITYGNRKPKARKKEDPGTKTHLCSTPYAFKTYTNQKKNLRGLDPSDVPPTSTLS